MTVMVQGCFTVPAHASNLPHSRRLSQRTRGEFSSSLMCAVLSHCACSQPTDNGLVDMQDMGPNNWFYINVMLDNSELFVPLPDQLDGEVEHALNSKLRGVALRWTQLRVGYFFGGDGEKILRVNAHELSMIGRLPEVVHSQVSLKQADSVTHLQLLSGKECCLAFSGWQQQCSIPACHCGEDSDHHPRLVLTAASLQHTFIL